MNKAHPGGPSLHLWFKIPDSVERVQQPGGGWSSQQPAMAVGQPCARARLWAMGAEYGVSPGGLPVPGTAVLVLTLPRHGDDGSPVHKLLLLLGSTLRITLLTELNAPDMCVTLHKNKHKKAENILCFIL